MDFLPMGNGTHRFLYFIFGPIKVPNYGSTLLYKMGQSRDLKKDYCCKHFKVLQKKHLGQVQNPSIHRNGQWDIITYKNLKKLLEGLKVKHHFT